MCMRAFPVLQAIFSDGSGAVIIGQEPMEFEKPLFELHASSSVVIPNTEGHMGWELSRTGMIVGLDKQIPKEVRLPSQIMLLFSFMSGRIPSSHKIFLFSAWLRRHRSFPMSGSSWIDSWSFGQRNRTRDSHNNITIIINNNNDAKGLDSSRRSVAGPCIPGVVS